MIIQDKTIQNRGINKRKSTLNPNPQLPQPYNFHTTNLLTINQQEFQLIHLKHNHLEHITMNK